MALVFVRYEMYDLYGSEKTNGIKKNDILFVRCELYKHAVTYGQIMALWGWPGDFDNDLAKNYVKVKSTAFPTLCLRICSDQNCTDFKQTI